VIHQLDPTDFEKAAVVLANLAEWNVYLTAVLKQNSPGRIYVDDVAAPRSAFAVSIDCAYLAGDPYNDAFNAGVTDVLEATLLAGDRVNPADPELAICVDSPDWEAALADILSHWRWPPIWGANHYYLLAELRLDWRKKLPSGYEIAQLDATLLAAQGSRLPQTITDSIRIGWQGEDNFLENGFGFAALHDDDIVCWCLADVTTGRACEIGIETAVKHRRLGLATAVTAATVEYCLKNGFTKIGWHCGADNPGSIRTAVNVGFVLERPYSFYSFYYDEAAHFTELGRIYFFDAQLYAEAAEMLEIAIEVGKGLEHYVYLLVARAWGWLANGRKAQHYLNLAIDKDFKDADLLQNLPEFAFLHGKPSWQKLLNKISATSTVKIKENKNDDRS
jgi:RimJ/RimL family protein N-acetyltransferase